MLFNSPVFLFAYLPVTLITLFLLSRFWSHEIAAAWLMIASLFFYGWWNPPYLMLMAGSIAANFYTGKLMGRAFDIGDRRRAKVWLIVGIAGDLFVLFCFKYFVFFIATVNHALPAPIEVEPIQLPLAISFFTFQQIAYLVDVYRGQASSSSLSYYSLFVSFFPHQIAGPIILYPQVMPQFTDKLTMRLDFVKISEGLTIFLLGLFKKVCLADSFSPYVGRVFDSAAAGSQISFFEGWQAALGYTLQIYFDFSGYSDMAIGLAAMMGIALPINFNSPYKAVNIIEFWRRWHITLSQFLKNYLYIPLGGNRKGEVRRYLNIAITMLLGGLWHGANWTFVFWGGLHGLFIIINHAWQKAKLRLGFIPRNSWWGTEVSRAFTFLCVVVAWVFFRAESFSAAKGILAGMIGLNGAVLPSQVVNALPVLKMFIRGEGSVPLLADGTVMGCAELAVLLSLGLLIVFCAKNLYEMTYRRQVFLVGITFAFTIQQVLFAQNISEFLYFRF